VSKRSIRSAAITSCPPSKRPVPAPRMRPIKRWVIVQSLSSTGVLSILHLVGQGGDWLVWTVGRNRGGDASRVSDVCTAGALEPDAPVVSPAVQLTAVLVLDKERRQTREDGVSHRRVASVAFSQQVAARLAATNALYRQTWHTRTETVPPDRVKRRRVWTAPPHRGHVFVLSSIASPRQQTLCRPPERQKSVESRLGGAGVRPRRRVALTVAESLLLPALSRRFPPRSHQDPDFHRLPVSRTCSVVKGRLSIPSCIRVCGSASCAASAGRCGPGSIEEGRRHCNTRSTRSPSVRTCCRRLQTVPLWRGGWRGDLPRPICCGRH